MMWRKEKPDGPGYWWCRSEQLGHVFYEIEEVRLIYGELWYADFEGTYVSWTPITNWGEGSEWYGPVSPPEDVKDGK